MFNDIYVMSHYYIYVILLRNMQTNTCETPNETPGCNYEFLCIPPALGFSSFCESLQDRLLFSYVQLCVLDFKVVSVIPCRVGYVTYLVYVTEASKKFSRWGKAFPEWVFLFFNVGDNYSFQRQGSFFPFLF